MLRTAKAFFQILRLFRLLSTSGVFSLFVDNPRLNKAQKTLLKGWMLCFPPSQAPSKTPYEGLRLALEQAGPAYVKLGQFLATRGDILPPTLQKELALLQDNLPPFSSDIARKMVETALERPLEDIFSSFSDPIAAASVAQVHCAILKTGEKVAVKILRPAIREKFSEDIKGFHSMARLLERLFPKTKRLRPVRVVRLLKEWMDLELNLRYEAAAASEYLELNNKEGGFYVPDVFWDYTTDTVLTTAWVDGIPLTHIDEVKASGVNLRELGQSLLQVFLKQATCHGFFHGDLHQGNLILMPSGQLAVVDFGLMGRLDEDTQRFLAEILYGFVIRDYKRIAEVHFEAGYVGKEYSVAQFAQALRALGEPIFGRKAKDISMGLVLASLFQVARSFQMETQPQLVLLQKTMVSVEGVARSLDEEADIWEAARPVLENWVRDQIGLKGHFKRLLKQGLTDFKNIPDTVSQIKRILDLVENRLTEKEQRRK